MLRLVPAVFSLVNNFCKGTIDSHCWHHINGFEVSFYFIFLCWRWNCLFHAALKTSTNLVALSGKSKRSTKSFRNWITLLKLVLVTLPDTSTTRATSTALWQSREGADENKLRDNTWINPLCPWKAGAPLPFSRIHLITNVFFRVTRLEVPDMVTIWD